MYLPLSYKWKEKIPSATKAYPITSTLAKVHKTAIIYQLETYISHCV